MSEIAIFQQRRSEWSGAASDYRRQWKPIILTSRMKETSRNQKRDIETTAKVIQAFFLNFIFRPHEPYSGENLHPDLS
jgi:hypothetical protein